MNDIDIDIEKKLAEKGLTEEEIKFIRLKAINDKITYSEVIRQLKKVFILFSLVFLLLFLFGVKEFFRAEAFGFYSYLFSVLVFLILAFVFAPLRLGAKAAIKSL